MAAERVPSEPTVNIGARELRRLRPKCFECNQLLLQQMQVIAEFQVQCVQSNRERAVCMVSGLLARRPCAAHERMVFESLEVSAMRPFVRIRII